MLSREGYILRTKKIKRITSDDGTITLKGNCDTDMVVDAVSRIQKYNTAVIMSGDSDFISMVNSLRGKKKKVIIISTRGHVAKDLIEAANHYVDLNHFRKHWELVK